MTRMTPYDYQEDAIQRILAEPTHSALVGSEVGRGKTLLAAEVALRAGWRRVLLIGVVHTFGQWDDTFSGQSEGAVRLRKLDSSKAGRANYEAFLAGEDGIFFSGMQWLQAQDWKHQDKLDFEGNPIPKLDKKTGQPTGKFERQRVHLETFRKMSKRINGGLDAIIFDEAHQVSNRDSIGRKTLLTFAGRNGAPMWKIGLSATWAGNSFENAWSLPKWMWPELIEPYWTWREKWCLTETQYVGGGRAVDVVVGEKEPEGAFVKTLKCYIRHEAEERAPEPIKLYVDATPQQRAQYEELKDELLTWAANWHGDREPLVVDIPAVLDSRLKQVALAELSFNEQGEVSFAPNAPSAKLHALRGVLDQWGDQPALIFVAGSEKFARLVSERMAAAGYNNALWTGKVSQKDRARIKQEFIDGKIQYLIATPESAGTGTDGWQRVCSKMVWLSSPDGNPLLEEQGVGRLFRPGRTLEYGAFQDVRILMRDSVDVEKLETLLAKGRAMRASIGAAALAA